MLVPFEQRHERVAHVFSSLITKHEGTKLFYLKERTSGWLNWTKIKTKFYETTSIIKHKFIERKDYWKERISEWMNWKKNNNLLLTRWSKDTVNYGQVGLISPKLTKLHLTPRFKLTKTVKLAFEKDVAKYCQWMNDM